MKALVLGIALVCSTSLVHAQEGLAYVNNHIPERPATTAKTMKNATYTKAMEVSLVPERARAFQAEVARYAIQEAAVYSDNHKTTYTVLFSEGKNTIEVVYDPQGNILVCDEKFEDVRVPYVLSAHISKKYPGWGYENVLCAIHYKKDQQPSITYTIVLSKGNKKKTISMDASEFI